MKTYILGKTKWENTISNPELFMWTDTCSKYEFHTEQDLLEMGAVPEPDEPEKKCEDDFPKCDVCGGSLKGHVYFEPCERPIQPEIEPIEKLDPYNCQAGDHLKKINQLIDAFNNHLTKRGGE